VYEDFTNVKFIFFPYASPVRQQKGKQNNPRNRCSTEILKHLQRGYSQGAEESETARELDGQAHK